MKSIKLIIGTLFLAGLFISVNPKEIVADPTPGDCYSGGFCSDICGDVGLAYCTYMDCGSGTQMCYKNNGIGPLE